MLAGKVIHFCCKQRSSTHLASREQARASGIVLKRSRRLASGDSDPVQPDRGDARVRKIRQDYVRTPVTLCDVS